MSVSVLFTWWAWAAFALVLAILEVAAPGFVLLGFSIGAVVVTALLGLGGAAAVGGTVPWMLCIYAAVSLVAWIILRKSFALKRGQVKVFEEDING